MKCPLDSYQPLWYRHQAPQLVRPLPHAPACSCPSSCPLHPLELPLTDGGPDAEGAVDDEHNEETQVAQRAITAGKGGAGRGGGSSQVMCQFNGKQEGFKTHHCNTCRCAASRCWSPMQPRHSQQPPCDASGAHQDHTPRTRAADIRPCATHAAAHTWHQGTCCCYEVRRQVLLL